MNLTLSSKKVAAAVLFYSGIVSLMRSLKNNSSIILAYHRVLPGDYDGLSFIQPGMYVTAETFDKHMAFISKRFTIMKLEDLGELPVQGKSCVVTFDDGWADNFSYAFPVLKRYNIPATIFLSTGMIGSNNWPWPDRITHYIQATTREHFLGTFASAERKIGHGYSIGSFSSQGKGKMREEIISYMKAMDNWKIEAVMNELDQVMSRHRDLLMESRPWLTWDEIAEMKDNGVSFGSHTHNHLILDKIPFQQAREELVKSREIIAEKTGMPVGALSYPNGNHNADLMRMARECGYEIAVTTQRGTINDSHDLLALKRVMIHNDMTNTIPMLSCVLTNKIPFF